MKGSNGNGFTLIDSKFRLFILNLIILASLLFVLFYIFYLQIVKGMEFKEQAKNVTLREIPIPSQRGLIYDKYYDVPLVYNIDSFAVNLIPGNVADEKKPEVFNRLSAILNIEEIEIQKKVPLAYYNHYQPIEIKSGVSFETISYIAENFEDFSGVTWNAKPIRGYRDFGSFSHIVGYIGDITTEELLLLYNQGYNYTSTIGKSGIEKQYDNVLRGKDGKRYKIVDVREKQLMQKSEDTTPPEPGKTLVLTIDRKLQKLCEKALGERIGTVIVMRPATGEILAMVSYPWFDPNIFYADDNKQQYNMLRTDPRFPFLNRAVQSVYPPASVYKTLMSVAFIEEDVFPIDQTVNCTGEFTLGNRTSKCWREYGHGVLDFFGGLENSCNVYFWTVGVHYLKIDNIVRYARDFGIGSLTGIDLPEEAAGFLPTPEWKMIERNTQWFSGDTMNVCIGQGWTLVSPLQLGCMVAMISNSGVMYKPHLLKEIRDPITGELLESIQKEVIHESRVSQKTFDLVQQAMRQVVTKGTARYFVTTKAIDIAGKTGTPETGTTDILHSWFVSYAPYETDNPDERILVSAIIEDAYKEKWYATKTANIIYQGYFADQKYEEAAVTLYPWMKKKFENAE